MQLSLQFIYLKIAENFPETQLYLIREENPLCDSLRLLTDPFLSLSPNLLYICPDSAALHNCMLASPCVPILLLKSQDFCFEAYPRIVLPDTCNLYEIFNLLLSIFQKYQTWAENVNHAILGNKNLQEILNITTAVIDNPMYIADLSFKMLASLGKDMEEMSVIWRYQIQYGYLPYHVMSSLIKTGELDSLNSTRHAFYVHSQSFTRNFISKSIRYQGKIQGHFFIIEIYHNLNQCDIEIADYLGELLSNATYNNKNYLTISSFYHENFMIDILENTLTDRTLIQHQLNAFGWEPEGDFSLLLLSMDDDSDHLIRSTLASTIEQLDAQSFFYQEYFIIVFNNYSTQKKTLLHHIQEFLSMFKHNGALSESFSYFGHMSYYYQQAVFALNFGLKSHSSKNFFYYEDCIIAHMLSLCSNQITCYRPVELLDAHDSKHHTDYCFTLYVYLINERNIVRTAAQLYLHRNTLSYRLEKIADIISIDLDHPMIRFRTLCSLYSLKRIQEKSLLEP